MIQITDESNTWPALLKNTMVLREFFDAKKEKLDDFESPDAFEKEDCLSCRVLGMCGPNM